jgi:tRNA 2-thiouridine synthesizing protein D
MAQAVNYALLVLGAPGAGDGTLRAGRFARALLARGHTLERVFFYDEAAATGNGNCVFAQDETDRVAHWAALNREHGVELVLCVASALRRGVLDQTEARRYERGANLHPAFILGGLGQLVDACARCDRLITFGR